MSVAFEPGPVGRRRRLPDRAALISLVAIAFVALAVIKPWDSSAGPPAASEAPAGLTASAAPQAAPIAVPAVLTAAESLISVLPEHDAWGFRVLADRQADDRSGDVVHPAGGAPLSQYWTAVTPAPDVPPSSPSGSPTGGAPTRTPIAIADAVGSIRYLGLTSPSRDPVLDLRVSRIGPEFGEPRWLEVGPLEGDPGLGEWLLPPPWVGDRELDEWPSGTYRFDVLRAGSIGRLLVVVEPGPSRPAEVPRAPKVQLGDPQARGGWPPITGGEPSGFIVADGSIVPLPSQLSVPLDERDAWLAPATAVGELGPAPSGSGSPVVRGWVPSATGIGVRFPPGTTSISATLVRLGPAQQASYGQRRTGSVRIEGRDWPWAIVEAPAGAALAPGSYRLDVAWREGAKGPALHGSVHLELEPNPIGPLPGWLAAARGMAPWSGRSGFVVPVPARAGAATDSAIQFLAEAPDTAPTSDPALGDACSGGVVAGAGLAVLGLAHPGAERASDVTVEALRSGDVRQALPVRAVLDPVPGLVLLAPDGPWPSGRYVVSLSGPGWSHRSVVCIGSAAPAAAAP